MEVLRDEVRRWLEANWSEDLTLREWWRRLADAGLAAPTWPAPYGRGLMPAQSRTVTEVLAAAGVVGPPLGNVGVRLAGPTLLAHATPEQCDRFLVPMPRYLTLTQVHRLSQQRARALAKAGRGGGEGSLAKLAIGRICNLSRDLSFAILGPDAMLAGEVVATGLSSPGVTIGAGTDEIQRTTIGERVLGLPREPNADVDPHAGG